MPALTPTPALAPGDKPPLTSSALALGGGVVAAAEDATSEVKVDALMEAVDDAAALAVAVGAGSRVVVAARSLEGGFQVAAGSEALLKKCHTTVLPRSVSMK